MVMAVQLIVVEGDVEVLVMVVVVGTMVEAILVGTVIMVASEAHFKVSWCYICGLLRGEGDGKWRCFL